MAYCAKIENIETYLPKNTIMISELCTENGWDFRSIYEKTGIRKVHRIDSKQTTIDLAFRSSKKILNKTNKDSIDAIICVTQSSDFLLPSMACILQDKLKLKKNILAYDINQGCSGYLYALYLANEHISSGLHKKILIVCADSYSKYFNKNNRSVSTIFSDGSASTLISRNQSKLFGKFLFGTDGSGQKDLFCKNPYFNKYFKSDLFMNGASIFRFTTSEIPNHIRLSLKNNKFHLKDIKLFFFHQASKLVLNSLKNSLSIDSKKIFSNIKNKGNTISSSIPFALKEASKKNYLKKDSIILLCGFGVGLSWGSCIYQWKPLK